MGVSPASHHGYASQDKDRAKTWLLRLCFCAENNTPLFLRFLRVQFSRLFDFFVPYYLAHTYLLRKLEPLFPAFSEKRDIGEIP